MPSCNEKFLLKQLGKAIARQRKEAHLTQEEVGNRLDIGSEQVSRIERGTATPDVLKLYELAEIFQCPVQNFFIEASGRPLDQTERITELLKRLSINDRILVMRIIENLANRLETDIARGISMTEK